MAVKDKKKSKKAAPSRFRSGMSAKDLEASLKSRASGGGGDPELVTMGDGDQVELAFVGDTTNWGEFDQHYVRAPKDQGGGYRICPGSGCPLCDDGDRPQLKYLVPAFIIKRHRPAKGKYEAKTEKNVGYRYVMFNKTTAEKLLKRIRRRGTLQDAIYLIIREGDGLDTDYEIEKTDEKPSKKMLNGWEKMDAIGKLEEMFEKEQKASGPLKKGKKSKAKVEDDDDDDYDYDDDDLDDDDDEDEDDEPRKKSKKSKSKVTSKKKSKKSRDDDDDDDEDEAPRKKKSKKR